ncbi:Antitoxin Phd_YefM, type II toxin-antitoxin system [Streptomyces misionensis]|uniref:Antitoxin Phd_YefM, type II toxin-antitoxin system n=1 Tax=Streptomyces misionensis TaxID=67331 RepID=A0A1H5HSM7_9ACTN|nr:type II toxin-antitoxin system Phd/YefM family antitoxin [Streptomyces misionensis]SEE30963.1 Antitoxin Phd_YefM, type II toxin-antitoxin system [Streptomyces misionensis]
MTEAVSITHARPILSDIARRVATTCEPIVLTDHGQAIATIVPMPPGQADDPGDRPEAAGEALAG